MFSEELKLVFGFDPSGLFEKVILAPEIGTPRTSPPVRGDDDDSELEMAPGSDVVVVLLAGGSSFFIFGTLIFGTVIVNCPIAGCVRNEVTAITAIRIRDDDLVIKNILLKTFTWVVRREIF
jgi:hypothetical protein